MRKLLLPRALSTFVSLSHAQDVLPSLAGGSKAILFSFGGLSFLSAGTFDGGIGARYYLSDGFALRAGIQFTSSSQTNPANPVAPNTGEDGKASASALGFFRGSRMAHGQGSSRAICRGRLELHDNFN